MFIVSNSFLDFAMRNINPIERIKPSSDKHNKGRLSSTVAPRSPINAESPNAIAPNVFPIIEATVLPVLRIFFFFSSNSFCTSARVLYGSNRVLVKRRGEELGQLDQAAMFHRARVRDDLPILFGDPKVRRSPREEFEHWLAPLPHGFQYFGIVPTRKRHHIHAFTVIHDGFDEDLKYSM